MFLSVGATEHLLGITDVEDMHALIVKLLEIALFMVIGICGFVGDSIEMYFNQVSKGTLCEGANIEIEHVNSKLRCTKCGQLFSTGIFII